MFQADPSAIVVGLTVIWPQQLLRTSGTGEHEWHPSAGAHSTARNEPGRIPWELHTGRALVAEEITTREKLPEAVVNALLRRVARGVSTAHGAVSLVLTRAAHA